jgi:signal transduction histidine kinase
MHKRLRRLRLVHEVVALASALVLLTALSIVAFVIRASRAGAYAGLQARGRVLVEVLARNADYALYTRDVGSVATLVESARADSSVLYVALLDPEGRPIEASLRAGGAQPPRHDRSGLPVDPGEPLFVDVPDSGDREGFCEFVAAVVSEGPAYGLARAGERAGPELLGFVQVGLSKAPIRTRQRQFVVSMATLTLGLVALAVLLAAVLARRLVRPIEDLRGAARRIADGHLDDSLRPRGAAEVTDLTSTFGQMLTNLRATREEVGRRTRELEAKNAELERFAYTVSHDLKSPLITIRGFLGFAEKAARAGDVDRALEDLDRVVEATDRMHRLLDELLELSRIGRLMNPPETVPAADVVGAALRLIEGRVTERHARIHVAGGLPNIHGDRARLVEVFQNLMDNAVKFSDKDIPEVTVAARASRAGEPDTILLSDNGPGIAPRFHDKVFGLFERLDARAEGTGVGLALVKRIVEVHGGRIWIESAGDGTGATFCLQLPPPPGGVAPAAPPAA